MDEPGLQRLLADVASGAVSPDEAVHRLRRLPFADLGFAKVDHHRALRQGLPEAVYGQGKSAAQCRGFLTRRLPNAEVLATNSTADAARLVGGHDPAMSARPTAAIAPRLASTLYGLDILVEDVEDHPDNQTRFVALARTGIPAPTGHDRTSIACFQNADHPGSLHAILGQFAARSINLSKLESRPTKQALGDYCFIIDFEGHIADAVVSDCLRDLHAELAGVKFLGSYPAAGPTGPALRREAETSWKEAGAWVDGLRAEVRSNGTSRDAMVDPKNRAGLP